MRTHEELKAGVSIWDSRQWLFRKDAIRIRLSGVRVSDAEIRLAIQTLDRANAKPLSFWQRIKAWFRHLFPQTSKT